MRRKFITNLALVLVLNLLTKPFWVLFIDQHVQNQVGTKDFGNYYALLNFSFILNILLDLGITNFNNRNISQHHFLVTKHVSSIIALRMMLALVYLSITVIVGFIIGYNVFQFEQLGFLLLNQIFISFILYLRSNIAGLHMFKTDSIISVLDRLIMIIICSVLLWGHITHEHFKIQWYIYAQTAGYCLTAFITLLIVINRTKLKKLTWRPAFFVMILKQSYPYAILTLLMTFYTYSGSVMIERLLPDGALQSGIYASANRLLDASNMIAFLFSGLLLPIFARMIKLKEHVEEMVKLAVSLLIVPALIVAIGSFAYREELMSLLYKNNAGEAADVFGILMFCFVAISSTYIFGTLLTANGNLKQLNIMASIGMLINISLNLFLIPHFKATGCASASLATQLLTGTAQVIMVQRIFKFNINYRFILSLIIFVLCTVLIYWASRFISPNWKICFGFAVASCFAFAFVIRLISIRNIRHILLNEQ
jgi:O-antigen/teichoic acid export membrane protein